MRVRFLWLGAALTLLVSGPTIASTAGALARGDAAYADRAVGHDRDRALPGPISQAIAAYEEALAEDPSDQAARTGLLRALFYLGDYVLTDRGAKLAVFERGQILAEEGITMLISGTDLKRRGGRDFDRLIGGLSSEPHAAALYYWAAVHWGLWGRHRGKIAAAKQGVAGKIRDYATIVIALDPTYEDGGGHRMLGRLHAEAPKLPFVTGWIDRRTAIAELETARSMSGDALTGLYFAEALLEYDSSRREEALDLLRQIVRQEPKPEHLLEELRAIQDARALLEELGG